MRLALAAGGALLAAMLTGNSAGADAHDSGNWFWRYYNYPWCLSAMTELYECSYRTLELCNYARNGVGGSCIPNPRYVDRTQVPPRGKTKRVHR